MNARVADGYATGRHAVGDDIAQALLHWFDRHGRHDLPWQHPRTPYRVWVSEIMLQQTQVAVASGYFLRFMAAFPTLAELAAADEDQVLAQWSGLGYYSRARNLHRAARQCVQQHGGELPRDLDGLLALPGIGRSTAGAVLAQAHGERVAILDGNVRRVLCRLHGLHGTPGSADLERRLWELSTAQLPQQRLADYTQALMDFGATLCRRARPDCAACPLRARCVALREDLVAQLPQPRQRKPLPTRECVMLVLLDRERRVLLQRRTKNGVWAGLWSLPECADADRAEHWLRRHVRPGTAAAILPSFEHVFSHYRLRVAPHRWVDCTPATVADRADLRWATRDELRDIGLPAPVRRLLHGALDEELEVSSCDA